jgi:hypothetical protein
MTLRTWIDKLLGRQTPSTERPPPRGLDEPDMYGPEEGAVAGKAEEDRSGTPSDPRNP